MKFTQRTIQAGVLGALLSGASGAFAQLTPTTEFVLTNLPATVSSNTTTTLFTAGGPPTANVISLRQGQGMAVAAVFGGTNAAANGALVVNWAVSLDGTNYSTTGLIQSTAPANGAATVVGVTNLPAAALNNVQFITPYSIQNTTTAGNGGIALGSLTVSFGNIVPGSYP